MGNGMDNNETAQIKMDIRALERRVKDLEDFVQEIRKNGLPPNRDISQSPAPQRGVSRF